MPGRALHFGRSETRAVEAVLAGNVDAGTVRTGTLECMLHQGAISRHALHVFDLVDERTTPLPFLLSTRTYPEWPLARRPSAETLERGRAYLAGLPESEKNERMKKVFELYMAKRRTKDILAECGITTSLFVSSHALYFPVCPRPSKASVSRTAGSSGVDLQ